MWVQRLKTVLIIALLPLIFISNAQSQPPVKMYSAEWKKVDDFVSKNLPKSAMTVAEKIYAQAKKDNQDAQVIKALIYMGRLRTETEENDEVIVTIRQFEKELASSREPVTSILKSELADLYWGYFQQHRWELYDRTNTADFKKDDIATWTADDLHARIGALYLQSVGNSKLLQQTRLDGYEAILNKGNVRHLRPTLYDLLVFRAINYFSTGENAITKPENSFEIDQAAAFDPAADFVHRKFITTDSLSLEHKALLLYQEVIAFHLKDAKPDALIDADLARISFVKEKSTHPDKDQLYFNAINHIAHQYGQLPAASYAWYLLADYYNTKANEYKPYGDSTWRYGRVKALEICDRLIAQKDSSMGKYAATLLSREIKSPALTYAVEKVNVPGTPFRSLVTYRNISNLSIRLVKATPELRAMAESDYGKYWSSLLKAVPVKSWQQALPPTSDYQEHKVEIKVDGLPIGEYILVASDRPDFDDKKSTIGSRYFYVSNLAYVNRQFDLFVVNRTSGKPIPDASVTVWKKTYDYKTYKNIFIKLGTYKADRNGYVYAGDKAKVAAATSYSGENIQYEIKAGDDHLFLNDDLYRYYYTSKPETTVSVSAYTFLDRSIYRPGQTVYFKSIVLVHRPEDKNWQLYTDHNATVYLNNANGEVVDSVKVKTNDYGSFHGSFKLPEGTLNGSFSISTDMNTQQQSFQVEEYKRPKFYVDFDTLKTTYKINDKITVTGNAKAYAGNNIDGATVNYRVRREPRYLYPWMFWRWWQPPTRSMEIAHGTAKTDKDGKFTIEFTAIPDLTIDKKFDPVFDYAIEADVTDINGETRSGNETVSVSYKSLMIDASIPERTPADSLRKLMISTENMNGQFVPAKLHVSISKLKGEQRLIRERYWERPDQFVMSKAEYIRNFPNDEYDDEGDYRNWQKEAVVYDETADANENGNWDLSGKSFKPGFYVVEITTKDASGNEVKDVRYVELYDAAANTLTRPQYLWADGKTNAVPGEKATVTIGTSANDVFVIQQTIKDDDKDLFSFNTISQARKTYEFPITEDDRGGFSANWIFVKDNRFFVHGETIYVGWENKQLDISYASFRDKTLPGSEETWKVRITGYKKDAVAAEMLASMYDASLDQFAPHSWTAPAPWASFKTYIYGNTGWQGQSNFRQDISVVHNPVQEIIPAVIKNYDQLITVASDGYGDVILVGYGRSYKKMAMAAPAVPNATMVDYRSADQALEGKAAGIAVETDSTASIGESAAPTRGQQQNDVGVQVRKNFNETAFFLPDLHTDADGNIEFSFTMPEALTRWKFQALAHTKDLSFGYSSKEIVTQKDLMVQPNPPRFLREGDKMEFSAKVVNTTGTELTGTASFELIDAETNEPVDGLFRNVVPNQYFTVAAGESELLKFPIEVPYQYQHALLWRIVAKAGNVSDGEENALPVLTNRMLVTETLPLPMRGTGTSIFNFDKLLQSGNSETLEQHGLTIEYTSNPAWYAVQSLPYLIEYPYECAEQTWNRYYANSLASSIISRSPKLQQVFEKWRITDTTALMSNLQKNQELKAVLLEETPWVLDAKTEAQQKKNIALLFDMVKMSQQLNNAFEKLKQMQSENGGFVWFSGGPDDRYITQYIVTGIGHLKKLNGVLSGQSDKLNSILVDAIPYLDRKIKEDYDNLVKNKVKLATYSPGYTEIQYLYMRSFFSDYKIPAASQVAYNYFRSRIQATWTQQNKYMESMIALALYRTGDKTTPAAILKSLKETAINNAELGMYWKDAGRSWWWYDAPIERQALAIEAFQEIAKDTKTVDDLRTWLLKNKQTNNWGTTKNTAEACYALLLQGTQWTDNDPVVTIQLGNAMTIRSTEQQQEAGTGYFKTTVPAEKVRPEMGKVRVTVDNPAGADKQSATWGSVYWQYFENLDKITFAETPLRLSKKLFVETNTARGPVLTPVNDGDNLKVGDKIKVRVELRLDRDMEYVQMKDMRASALEPVDVISGYHWQGGLGYYQVTKDASTNFFFDRLSKGTYVFEYNLFVTHAGNFSNGITTIQCMYAPEFTAHSEGVRINVE